MLWAIINLVFIFFEGRGGGARGGGVRGGIPQLATEPVEPKPDADILPRHSKSLIASVSSVRASAIGSS